MIRHECDSLLLGAEVDDSMTLLNEYLTARSGLEGFTTPSRSSRQRTALHVIYVEHTCVGLKRKDTLTTG